MDQHIGSGGGDAGDDDEIMEVDAEGRNMPERGNGTPRNVSAAVVKIRESECFLESVLELRAAVAQTKHSGERKCSQYEERSLISFPPP